MECDMKNAPYILATESKNGFDCVVDYDMQKDLILFLVKEKGKFVRHALPLEFFVGKEISFKNKQILDIVKNLRGKIYKSFIDSTDYFDTAKEPKPIKKPWEDVFEAYFKPQKDPFAIHTEPKKPPAPWINKHKVYDKETDSQIFTVITGEKYLRFSVDMEVLHNQVDRDSYKDRVQDYLKTEFKDNNVIVSVASWLVLSYPPKFIHSTSSLSGASYYLPGIDQKVKCPDTDADICGYQKNEKMSLHNAIMHLNDQHKWTREAIADWIETFDDVPVFQVKEDKDEGKLFEATTLASFKQIL